MRTILITGVSGSGKTTLARHLRKTGLQAVSLDGHPGLCDWIDHAGQPVTWPQNPDAAWLDRHRWVWRADVLDTLIAEARAAGAGALYLCGRADNAQDMRDRFDAVVVLHIDQQTMLQRLLSTERGNPFGRNVGSREHLAATIDATQEELATWADATVDACQPVERLADDVMAAAALAVLRATNTDN